MNGRLRWSVAIVQPTFKRYVLRFLLLPGARYHGISTARAVHFRTAGLPSRLPWLSAPCHDLHVRAYCKKLLRNYFSLAPVDGFWVLAVVGWGLCRGARGLVWDVSGRGRCWVAAFCVRGRSMLAVLFITISHCPWRDFISWSFGDKETEAKKTPFHHRRLSVPSVQFHCRWHVSSTVLARAPESSNPAPTPTARRTLTNRPF